MRKALSFQDFSGAMARAGFASADLRAANPRLITVDISGYGEEGEYAAMKAYDLLVQAESGLASVTGPSCPGMAGCWSASSRSTMRAVISSSA